MSTPTTEALAWLSDEEAEEPTCAICGWLLTEHGMEGYPGHPFTHRRPETPADDAERETERIAEDRKHSGMARFFGGWA